MYFGLSKTGKNKILLVSTEKVNFYIGLVMQIETKLEQNISVKDVELRTRTVEWVFQNFLFC